MEWEAEILPARWKRLRQHVEPVICSYVVAQRGEKIVNTWSDMSGDDKKKLTTYFDRFEAQVEPKGNPNFTTAFKAKRIRLSSL